MSHTMETKGIFIFLTVRVFKHLYFDLLFSSVLYSKMEAL